MSTSAPAFLVIGLTLASVTGAQEPFVTEETAVETVSVIRQGSEPQAALDEARSAIKAGNATRAVELLNGIVEDCESRTSSPDTRVLSFANVGEFIVYSTTTEGTGSVSWVDMTCPLAYHDLAYIHAGNREFDQALPLLDTSTKLAPYWAQPHVERGYILNQLRRFQEALESYEKAIELTRFESSRDAKPSALRGAGFALIELDDLDAARARFNESLELEPGNAIALSELRYIDQLESSQLDDD